MRQHSIQQPYCVRVENLRLSIILCSLIKRGSSLVPRPLPDLSLGVAGDEDEVKEGVG